MPSIQARDEGVATRVLKLQGNCGSGWNDANGLKSTASESFDHLGFDS